MTAESLREEAERLMEKCMVLRIEADLLEQEGLRLQRLADELEPAQV